ncbi:MAG: hypothetical protein EOO28_00710 [Comamonadaceae bacterium]|nr:MAG: hypothetical protein EOO28_00710 [Comamonadaceae bacterium]
MIQWTRNLIIWLFCLVFTWWYAFFVWEGIPANTKCFSPNREFYLVKVYPLTGILSPYRLWNQIGTVKIFTKTGKVIASGESEMDDDAGPNWSDQDSPGNHVNSVYFLGAMGKLFELPAPPGENRLHTTCY